MKRGRFGGRKDKKLFTRTAMQVNSRNLFLKPMRGGGRF